MADYTALISPGPPPASDAGTDYTALTRRSPSIGEDVVGSGLSGLQRGVVGLAGLPGDLIKGGRWLAGKAGLPTVDSPVAGSAELQQEYERIGGPTHEPQTVPGEYAATIGAFAPAAIGGPAGIGRRVAQAVAPAFASETAGQVTRQVAPEYEDTARIVAGVGTALPMARAGASRLPKGAAPETDELRQMADLAYKRADQAGLVMKPKSFSAMVAGAIGRIKKEGIDPTIHPKATAAAKRLIQAVNDPNPKTLQEFDTLRRVVRAAAKSTDADERRIANIMIDRMDDWLDGLKAADISAGDLRMAANSLKEARSLWARMRKSEMIDDALERAGLRAGQFSVAGNENAIRTEFRQMAIRMTRDKRFRNTFTPEEQKLIRQLGNMGSGVNILRTIGKLAPRSALTLGGGAAYAYSEQDPVATGVAWGGGELARLIALGLTKRKAGQLQARVRSGGMSLIPGAPANPVGAAIASQAATLPWRQDQ